MSQIHLLRGSQVKWSKDSVIWGYWISADKAPVFMLTQVSEIRVNCAALYHMLAVSIVLTIFARQGALVGFYSRAWDGVVISQTFGKRNSFAFSVTQFIAVTFG